ncbi:MAG TPA: hypothetical protein ENJ37_07265 [Deltaproteobacteria bacterium]|nr:hypothetical protein [Deltaproteobacteria bacterium]
MPRKLFALIVVVAAAGCSAPLVVSSVEPRVIERAVTAPREVMTAAVGEELVLGAAWRRLVWRGYVVTRDFPQPSPPGQRFPPLQRGSVWKVAGVTDDGGEVLRCMSRSMYPRIPGVVADWQVCLIARQGRAVGSAACYDNGSFSPFAMEWDRPEDILRPREIEESEVGATPVRLLYSGRVGPTVMLTELPSPAGAAEERRYTFDLSDSTVIGVRGVRLEIVEATNTRISYRVLSTGE